MIQPDEHNILMDFPSTAIALDDMKRFRDCGMSTVWEILNWQRVETARGVYDWSQPDEMVERCRAAGMKALLWAPSALPQWMPDDWYVWDANGRPMKEHDPRDDRQTWGCLSPWNQEAMGYQLAWAHMAATRYNSDDVQVVSHLSQEGETMLPPAVHCVYDPAAVKSYRAYVGDKTAVPFGWPYHTMRWMHESLVTILIEHALVTVSHPSRECWVSLHPVYHGWPASGVTDAIDMIRAVKMCVRPTVLRWMVFSYFQPNFEPFIGNQLRLAVDAGAEVWTGSEWPEGLAPNTPRAIAAGIYGLLTAPLHPFLHRDVIEDWVFDAVSSSRHELLSADAERAR